MDGSKIRKHLISFPQSLTYPFKFKDWVSKNYFERSKPTISIVIKSKNWIVGHISYRIEKNKVHLFHLIIDKKFRRLGLSKLLIDKVERDCFLKQKDYITLNVLKKNKEALNLYKKLGYVIFKNKNSKTIVMKKNCLLALVTFLLALQTIDECAL